MQNIFLDTEFTSLDQSATLLSLAIIDEFDRVFYAERDDYLIDEISPWVEQNVINNFFLKGDKIKENRHYYLGDRHKIIIKLKEWLSYYSTDNQPTIRIWADVPHWDWILFCELFGGALKLPQIIHYMPMDITTALYVKGIDINKSRIDLVDKSKLPQQLNHHNALYDAHLARLVYNNYLKS